jgi:hypothetical protein
MSEGAGMTDRGTSEAPYATRAKIEEYLLRTNGNGEIVSTLGPCVCGAAKREWHKICLREKSHE